MTKWIKQIHQHILVNCMLLQGPMSSHSSALSRLSAISSTNSSGDTSPENSNYLRVSALFGNRSVLSFPLPISVEAKPYPIVTFDIPLCNLIKKNTLYGEQMVLTFAVDSNNLLFPVCHYFTGYLAWRFSTHHSPYGIYSLNLVQSSTSLVQFVFSSPEAYFHSLKIL